MDENTNVEINDVSNAFGNIGQNESADSLFQPMQNNNSNLDLTYIDRALTPVKTETEDKPRSFKDLTQAEKWQWHMDHMGIARAAGGDGGDSGGDSGGDGDGGNNSGSNASYTDVSNTFSKALDDQYGAGKWNDAYAGLGKGKGKGENNGGQGSGNTSNNGTSNNGPNAVEQANNVNTNVSATGDASGSVAAGATNAVNAANAAINAAQTVAQQAINNMNEAHANTAQAKGKAQQAEQNAQQAEQAAQAAKDNVTSITQDIDNAIQDIKGHTYGKEGLVGKQTSVTDVSIGKDFADSNGANITVSVVESREAPVIGPINVNITVTVHEDGRVSKSETNSLTGKTTTTDYNSVEDFISSPHL